MSEWGYLSNLNTTLEDVATTDSEQAMSFEDSFPVDDDGSKVQSTALFPTPCYE